MSIIKDENWDILTQNHEDFVKKAHENGFPIWMISMYSSLPIHQQELSPETK